MSKNKDSFGNLMKRLSGFPTNDSSAKDGEKTNSKSERSSGMDDRELMEVRAADGSVIARYRIGVDKAVGSGSIYASDGTSPNTGSWSTGTWTNVRTYQQPSKDIPGWMKKNAVFGRKRGGGLLKSSSPPEEFKDPNDIEEVDIDDAQLMTAKIKGKNAYRLLLDLDGPHKYLVSSSGNGHLVIDVELSREEHDLILELLSSVGIIQNGFSESAKIKKQGASLRLPWVKKGEDKSRNEQLTS